LASLCATRTPAKACSAQARCGGYPAPCLANGEQSPPEARPVAPSHS
jgi:hypothetical protein